MSKAKDGAQAVTANRLDDGIAVFLAVDGRWHERIEAAAVARGSDAAADLLARAEQAVAACVVVGPYLIDVTEDDGRVRAQRYRERIRAQGPSVRPDLGKQAEAGA